MRIALGRIGALCYKGGMFGRAKPALPITLEQHKWIDASFIRLAAILGAQRLLQATVVLPIPAHFPDPYDRSEAALQRMFARIAARMQVDPADVDLTLFATADNITKDLTPLYSGNIAGPAGLYYHAPADRASISINQSELKDPVGLVATLAHEIGHIILLRPGLIDRNDSDMEPLNDLLTVFLGFGIFTANSSFRFEQHQDERTQGWSARRLGYLSEQQLGYALARFAFERVEEKPAWRSFLSTNIRSYFKRSAAWLDASHEPRLFVGDQKVRTTKP